jgi:DNA-directed RNA polymerase subunit N (RpoN/RPB10)
MDINLLCPTCGNVLADKYSADKCSTTIGELIFFRHGMHEMSEVYRNQIDDNNYRGYLERYCQRDIVNGSKRIKSLCVNIKNLKEIF